MPTYLLAIILYVSPEIIKNLGAYSNIGNDNLLRLGFKENLLLFIFFCTFAAPASIIVYLHKINIIPSLEMEDLKSRRLPYLITTLALFFTSYFIFKNLAELKEISILLLAVGCSVLLVFLISLFWKISAHTTGIGGVIGTLATFTIFKGADNLFYILLFSIILGGLVATARLKLNAHTPNQIIAGLCLGLIISTLSSYIFI